MIDDSSAIKAYSKENIYRILEGIQNGLPPTVTVPLHSVFPLHVHDTDTLMGKIADKADSDGLQDIVIKPSAKGKKSSMAYLYNIKNPVHRRQLKKALRKLDKEPDIPYVIMEENVGSGIIDGRKLEVRVHCLSR